MAAGFVFWFPYMWSTDKKYSDDSVPEKWTEEELMHKMHQLFKKVCIHTHTHTHTYIYIHIS